MLRVLLSVALLLAANVTVPDLRTGNVDGLKGVLFWPADMPNPKGEPQPLPSAEGCEVHFVPHSDLDRELRYPCGKWLVLPASDRYNVWLETNGRMTPSLSMLVYSRKPFDGAGMGSIMPVTPAGLIAANRSMPESESLRFLLIHAGAAWADRIFDRRVPARDAHTPVQMPEGRVVAGRFDKKTNDAIALTRPVDIRSGTTTRVWPAAPSESDLLVVLTKPPELMLSKPIDARLVLDDGTSKKAPDVIVNGFERIIAIWYGVSARTAKVSLQSTAAFWAPQDVRFTRGKVTTVRSTVARLPKVSVSIDGNELPQSMALDVGSRHLDVGAGVHDVEALPAEPLRVTLTIGKWKFNKDVDLSSGNDAQVAFDLEPIAVHGTVFHGDRAAPADIAFRSGEDEWVHVETDERGQYEATFWAPDEHTIRVKLKDSSAPPFLDAFREISKSGTLDFHVPRTDYVVHVRDATTGRGVAGARVIAGSIWIDDASRSHEEAQRVATDADGTAILPPLRKGQLIVDVHAEGFAAVEPLRMAVDDEHHELEIALQPLRSAMTLQLMLPSGAPAAGADVWAFSDAMQPLWRGTVDAAGALEVPDVAAHALLLIRHANAASTIRRVIASETWTLEPAAEPLTLAASKAGAVALWIDGVQLSGPPLAFAAWSGPATNPAGVWIGRNLPRKPLQVLVSPGASGAQRVDYPWPARVTTPNF